MWVSFLKKVTVIFISCNILLSVQSLVIKKRSPLELGYATFPNEIARRHKHIAILNKAPEVVDIDKSNVDLSVSSTLTKIHHSEWIPGQIRHHSFIPAHVHHIYVPVLLTKDIQTVLVKPQENLYLYPRHYGGFGVGSYTGGQGAGHGFQIIFNS